MYGEAENAPDPSLNIPPERSLVGIKKWKRAIIMAAGIILNFVLAITLFVVNRCFCKQNFGTTQLLISEDSIASDAGLLSYDDVYQLALKPHINGEDLETQMFTVDDYYDTNSFELPPIEGQHFIEETHSDIDHNEINHDEEIFDADSNNGVDYDEYNDL